MVYSFVCSVGVFYDYLPVLAGKYGTPGYSRFYIFVRDDMVSHVYQGISRIVRLLEDSGFSGNNVYRVNTKNFINAFLTVSSIVRGIEDNIVLSLSSGQIVLDTLVLLAVSKLKKKYLLYITDGVENFTIDEDIIAVIRGGYVLRKGEEAILDTLLSRGGRCSIKEISEATGLAERTIARYVKTLRAKRFIAIGKRGWIRITDLGKLHKFLNK